MLHFVDRLDLQGLMADIAPRKLPRKAPRSLTRSDGGVCSISNVVSLQKQITGRSINGMVLHEREVQNDAIPARKFVKGRIIDLFFQRGQFFWNVKLDDESVIAMDMHEAVGVVELGHSSGVDVCGI